MSRRNMESPNQDELIQLLRQQMDQQRAQMDQQRAQMEQQMDQQRAQMEALLSLVQDKQSAVSNTKFNEFDPSTELWSDYLARFQTFTKANSIPDSKKAEIFLTNQSSIIFKLLKNLAEQQQPPKDVNQLTMDEIEFFLGDQYNPKRFVVRERFKFWTKTDRKSRESVHELAARIRQEAATCDFASITDPLDEAMRTRFVCSVSNEATLKALFKIKDDDLTFARAIEVAAEAEEASKVAKETVNSLESEVHKTQHMPSFPDKHLSNIRKPQMQQKHKRPQQHQRYSHPSSNKRCFRCDGTHTADKCRFINAICRFCNIKGHIESACRKKKKSQSVKQIQRVSWNSAKPLTHRCFLMKKPVTFEVDTGSRDSFISSTTWHQLGKPKMSAITCQYRSASNDFLPVLGVVTVPVSASQSKTEQMLKFVVTKLDLNLLGRTTLKRLNISVDQLLDDQVHKIFDNMKPDVSLQESCKRVCQQFPDLFKNELGTLKDFELEVKFKPDVSPVFHKPRPVPIAVQDDLEEALQSGIRKGIWEPVTFNTYGTPVVPIRKKPSSGNSSSIRVCGDYSVTVNPQLETHRHPMPQPEDLMRKLGRGYGFTKIDLADAYNQITLAPESQRRLALSTHRGVLLQKRLPFGISSAPGYFQQIMDQLTQDLPGVAVYLDDILVSGDNAQQHVNNLRRLLQRLQDNGLRCRLHKCSFAQPYVEYLGHYLSKDGVAKGPKVDAVTSMPPPQDISSLRSFLGQVQFYGKFLPNLSTQLEPLYTLTKKDSPWSWGPSQETAFQEVKKLLSADTVLAHFDPSLEVGISCDASNVGIGAVLFHRYRDGSERPIANASKTLTATQRKYSQIQKEALSIIFALNKFHQFLYGRQFILVTDHKPLITLFGPTKAIPALAANRLARWALILSQYDYKIEYRKTAHHANADALSRLPSGTDANFDREEAGADSTTICTIKFITQQVAPADSKVLSRETAKDPVLSAVTTYLQNGWPNDVAATVKPFYPVRDSLSQSCGCLFYGHRVVIPESLQNQILQVLHLGHFGMQRMKQLARTAVYWPGIDADIEDLTRQCLPCNEHQRLPPKESSHHWVSPNKPWSRVHIDHAINFKGNNWLVMVDSFSKYPCIHPMSSITTRATTRKLEEDFAHFGYPHTLVTDNASCFSSQEFNDWCRERGIEHLHGAPYHPETNGAAERLVQTFKQSLKKSKLPPIDALQEFLITYRRTPLPNGSSPCQLLQGRQIRTKIDVIRPQMEGPESYTKPTLRRPVSSQASLNADEPMEGSETSNVKPALRRPTPSQVPHTPNVAESTEFRQHSPTPCRHGPRAQHLPAPRRQSRRTQSPASQRRNQPWRNLNVGSNCYALSYRAGRRDIWKPAVITAVIGNGLFDVKVQPDGQTWRRHRDQIRRRL